MLIRSESVAFSGLILYLSLFFRLRFKEEIERVKVLLLPCNLLE